MLMNTDFQAAPCGRGPPQLSGYKALWVVPAWGALGGTARLGREGAGGTPSPAGRRGLVSGGDVPLLGPFPFFFVVFAPLGTPGCRVVGVGGGRWGAAPVPPHQRAPAASPLLFPKGFRCCFVSSEG